MTENEAIEALTELRGYGSNKFASIGFGRKEALGMAIKALEQQSCEDCISREATIDAIYKKYIGGKGAIKNAPINDLYAEGLAEAVDAVWDMPSLTPKAKMGRWKPIDNRWGDIITTVNGYRCSECNAVNADRDNYCPNCGARMSESEGEE